MPYSPRKHPGSPVRIACVCVCVCARARARVRASERVRVRVYIYVHMHIAHYRGLGFRVWGLGMHMAHYRCISSIYCTVTFVLYWVN